MYAGPSNQGYTNDTGNMTVVPDIFDEFESYRFSDDPEFRAGLPTVIAAIRGQERSADQIDEMIGRAQWFYFTRMKGVSIPWETYARRQRTHPYVDSASPKAGLVLSRTASPNASPSGLGPTPLPAPKRPNPQEALQTLNNLAEARQMMKAASTGDDGGEEGLSFAMLSRLISEGRASEVPVRQIPEGTNEAQPSQAAMMARPKPWEIAHAMPYMNAYGPNLSPTFQSHPQTRASFTASGTASPFGQQPPDCIPGQVAYNISPQMRTGTNWPSSSAGPTISPDLNSFSLDPDMSYDPSTSSSNQVSSHQSPSTLATGMAMGIFDSTTSLDDTFSTYMDFGDPETTAPKPADNARGGGGSLSLPSPSPGVLNSSSSTPAPTSHSSGAAADNTPSSSHSL